MRLADRIELVTGRKYVDDLGNDAVSWDDPQATVMLPAQVTYASTALDAKGKFVLSEELRVICPPVTFDPQTQRLRWRGQWYTGAGEALIHMRGATPHHVTIPIKQITG
ncbi:hypothetical protein [Arsenicicoccus dermatophilus]|uniref:hypothetical protein n=1 Tax=Arsenicicoccus dermatophilus TaxID=1076331 RepID=UPI0039170DC3